MASDDPATLGPQDVVISTLKANGLGSLVTGLKPLLHDDTAIVFAQNGIPWWYDLGLASDQSEAARAIGFLDPGGALRAAMLKAAGHRRRDLFVERGGRPGNCRQSLAGSQRAADR